MNYDKKFSTVGICRAFGRDQRIIKRMAAELELQTDDKVLDIGCNQGELVAAIRPYCQEAIGIDINAEAIAASKVSGLKVMDATATDFAENYFTKIVSTHTVEHIPDLRKFFREVDRISAPDATIVLYYPWELWRGMGTMRNAWIFYHNPFKGYKLHLHRLNHRKIAQYIASTNLRIYKKKFFFDPWPGYITILKKHVQPLHPPML